MIRTVQGELDFRSAPVGAQADDAARLCAWLRGRGIVAGPVICHDLGWSQRRLKLAKQAASGLVTAAPGLRGYAHTWDTTPDRMQSIRRNYLSQISEMAATLRAMTRQYHRAPHLAISSQAPCEGPRFSQTSANYVAAACLSPKSPAASARVTAP